ncbi:MAG: CDP-diacylglycerol--glycerol-3-phosphate 3-phosphatidyltransferase [Spirochaetales bacterium]|jgi:CDP-diacylglycerol---glycerol-3-phosphate 3-phosphatidyltransferase|nr:CDP-diacylglycerol--glycerol-3-phosphate 3-phosphatidyltransferase [Spirochaetales bacterium]
MSLPNKITLARIALAPVFFCVFYIPRWLDQPTGVSLIFLWILFGIIEITDLLDGKLARKLDQTSDTGKLLDPFADSLSRLTYFLCFAIAGIMEGWVFLILLYRDLGVSFVRLMMSKKGITMGARLSGKLKAVVYAASGILGLGLLTVYELIDSQSVIDISELIVYIFFIFSALIAVWSLIDYLTALRPSKREQ